MLTWLKVSMLRLEMTCEVLMLYRKITPYFSKLPQMVLLQLVTYPYNIAVVFIVV